MITSAPRPNRNWRIERVEKPFRYSLATMFGAVTLIATQVAVGKSLGFPGVIGVWTFVAGVAVIWRSGRTERFSTFLGGVFLLLFALIIAASGN